MLRAEGPPINRKRVQRLMRQMGIAALGPKPRTTRPAPGHKMFPYLLRGLAIERPNQVWAADITYVPIGRGFLYLVAIMDWASRAVLAWRLSNTMDARSASRRWRRRWRASACRRSSTPTRAASSPAPPSPACSPAAGVRISMDGRGRWMDNVFIERLWRCAEVRGHLSEGLCRRARGQGRHRRVDRLLQGRRPHQALGNRTPMAVWREGRPARSATRLWT